MKEALYYESLEGDSVRCRLCPHNCLIHSGRVGICYVRQNIDGKLFALAYGRTSATHLDPIEKKPLYRFRPGSLIYSISSVGCNLGCPYCQNWEIAHPRDAFPHKNPRQVVETMTTPLEPEQAVAQALSMRDQGNIGIAYTYNEPLIGWEYVRDTARLAREQGLSNVLVTNGFISEEPLLQLLPFLDAVNVDIKGFSDDFYHRLGGRLQPVLQSARVMSKHCHVEVTNLLIPTWNTDDKQISDLVDWIAENMGPETPLHFSRYFPARKLALPSTTLQTLRHAQEIAEERLRYVFLGNV